MCFGSKQADPPALPPPDASVEAQKFASFKDTSDRIAKQKETDLQADRGTVYGLFGQRSLLGAQSQDGVRSLLGG